MSDSSIIYKDFFDYAKFPMLLIEENTTIILCNRAFEALSGYAKEDVEGRMSWKSLVADSDALNKMLEYHKIRRTTPESAPEEYEFVMIDSKGNKKDISLSIAMLPGMKRSLAFLNDITEKKRSEIWYKAVFENTGLPSIIIEPDTTIIKANSEWALLSGYSIEENEDKKSWTDFVDKEDLERMRNYHRSRRSDAYAAPRKYEFRFIRRNGEVRNMINSVTMIPNSPYSIASLLDITELRQAEAEARKLENQLQHARKLESIGHLAGGIAHDFNNMLAAILGYSQVAQIKVRDVSSLFSKSIEMIHQNLESRLQAIHSGEMPGSANGSIISGSMISGISTMIPFLRECTAMLEDGLNRTSMINGMIEEVIKASDRAANLTRQLLAFARQQTLEMKPIDLNRVITDLEKMLRRTIKENIDIKLDLSPEISSIEADVGQIEQIILNLAVNSQDAMPEGGAIVIRTGNRILDADSIRGHEGLEPGHFVMLEISDTGIGMEKEIHGKIFEPFFTTKAPGKGTGLGLATVYGIVKQHLAGIWFYSEPGKGTTFKIYFPKSHQTPENVVHGETCSEITGEETILVVEDQEQVRSIISMILEDCGYNVLVAENGQEAIETSGQYEGRIDLLVSDVVMPGMNGREVYNELIRSRPEIKALFMSGYPREIISHHGILDDGFNFLSKPVSVEELRTKVRDILDNR
jgi:PAS domain S-box-containing protein